MPSSAPARRIYTDGEQRRDSYASFVGGRLDNCQLVPLTDLLPLMDDPAAFERELRALDVPRAKSAASRRVRPHPPQPADRRARAGLPAHAHDRTASRWRCPAPTC
jgi:hypothetical protein